MTPLVNDERVIDWLAERISGFPKDITMHSSLAWERGERIVAACLYRNYYGRDIELVIGVDNAGPLFGPEALRFGFGYPFLQLGCRRVTANVASNNHKSKRLVERLGFKHEGTLRENVGEGIDMLVYGMLREECRWIL